MGMSVRVATPAEYPAIGAVCVAAYRADGQLDGSTGGYERVLADVADRARDADVLVALEDLTGEVLGSATFVLPGTRYAEISRPGEAEFRMLAVAPSARRRGVGRALTLACIRRAAGYGCASVVICTRDNNAVAQRLYADTGFVRIPDRDFSPVPGVDLLALRLDLAADRAARP